MARHFALRCREGDVDVVLRSSPSDGQPASYVRYFKKGEKEEISIEVLVMRRFTNHEKKKQNGQKGLSRIYFLDVSAVASVAFLRTKAVLQSKLKEINLRKFFLPVLCFFNIFFFLY